MRIVHVCLAAFYIDNYGYQENVLPKLHKKMGHDVIIVASTETYVNKTDLGYVEARSYVTNDGVPVHRIPYAAWVPSRLKNKVRAYRGLRLILEEFKPDLIFLHDLQFLDLLTIRQYASVYPTTIFADCHSDYVNSARGLMSRLILHGLFYRTIIRRTLPWIEKFFPTLPCRADFLDEVYGVDRQKMELLPFGVDDSLTEGLDRGSVRKTTRQMYGIPSDAVVIVTGGKLDLRKNIHLLVDRFSALKRADRLPNFHLLVFGAPDEAVQAQLAKLNVHPDVHLVGWTAAKEIYRMFWAADLAFFPGTHSVLWEEAIGHGLGSVLHRWPGMEHLDLGGNALFLDEVGAETIDRTLLSLANEGGIAVRDLGTVAQREGPKKFLFSRIAEQALASAKYA